MLLLCGIAAGFILLLAVYALPVARMEANVLASIPAFNGEWAREDSYEQLIPGYTGTQLDNSTDAAMLLHAIHRSDEPLTVRTVEGYRYISAGNAFGTLLYLGENGPEAMDSTPIARYWHGYLVLLKPLLLFLSYLDIRMLLSILQGAMMAAVIAGLCRRGLAKLIPAFLISLLCITPGAAGLSMQFSTAFCTFLLAMILLLYLSEKTFEGQKLALFFLLIGMLTSYVDYLTYPVVTFGMPFVLAVFLFPEKTSADEWKRLILCGILWAVGYFGMWAGKWFIAGIFSPDEWFWGNLLAKISERSSDQSAEMTLSYAAVLKDVTGVFFKRAYLLAGMAAAASWMISWLKQKKTHAVCCSAGLLSVLLAVAIIPFVWYFCTQNHSYNHAFYTSRNLAVTMFALTAFFTALLPSARR